MAASSHTISTRPRPGGVLAASAAVLLITLHVACAQDGVAKSLPAAPCTQAPLIDGAISADEWAEANHIAVELPCATQAGPVGARQAELWLMNSSERLLLAFRIEDPDPMIVGQMTGIDVFLAAFSRGDALAEGDDRKVMAPGIYVDKHVVQPGVDADDTASHGRGAMVYHDDGYYDVELMAPLDSGDGQDLAAQIGGTLRFNIAYADGLEEGPESTEVCGLYGPSPDDATNWGVIELAADVTVEAPAEETRWLMDLFPNEEAPDAAGNRLRRLEIDPLNGGGRVLVEFIHRDITGETRTGQGWVFVPQVVRDAPDTKVPLLHVAGYEVDREGGAALMRQGVVVSTPKSIDADPLAGNPMTRGPNLDIALLHAVRALPFVDAGAVRIQGGSAGGYTTLMLAAETFPLVYGIPDVPPVNWGYNAQFFFANKALAEHVSEGAVVGDLPVLAAVSGLATAAAPTMGDDGNADSYLMGSPISHIDTITAPIQVIFSTADMLVPVNQVSEEFVQARDEALFPEGYENSIERLMTRPETRQTFLDAIPEDRRMVYVVAVPEGAPLLIADSTGGKPHAAIELPFSPDHTFSIIVIDEGPQEPDVGHFRYGIAPNHQPFADWAIARGVLPDQLTEAKLERLMERYQGIEHRPFSLATGDAKAGVRLDFPEAERTDVLIGLGAFARDDACALRLAELYDGLPEERQALGASLGDGTPDGVRRTLADLH